MMRRFAGYYTSIRLACMVGLGLVWLAGCGTAPTESSQQTAAAERAASSSMEAETVPVTVARVVRQPIATYVQGTATLESEDTVQVLAEVPGLTTQVAVEEGDWVKHDQLLAQLDDRAARVQLERARVQLAEAKMAYTSLMRLDRQDAALAMRNAELAAADAQEQYRRAESMARRGLISEEELDAKRTQKATADVALEQGRVRLEYKTIDDARFRYDRAKTELQEAGLRLQYTTVKAPIAGVVSQRHVVRGQYVNTQQHLFTIVDTTRILVRPFLPEKFSGRLQAGQAVSVEVEALPAQRFPARVKLISPVVDAASGTFKVTVELDKPPPQLKPGMFATVYITVEQRANALVIPKRALTLDNLRPTVYRIQRGRARQVVLTVGVTDNAVVEVLSGLTEGDQVVVVGQDKLLDNAMVQVVPE